MKKATYYLISQYYDSKNIRAIIDSLESVIEGSLEQALLDIQPQMTSKAVGYWAELLAKRFMVSRPFIEKEVPSNAKFFGFCFGNDPTITRPHRGTFWDGSVDGSGNPTDGVPFSDGSFHPYEFYPASDAIMSAITKMQTNRILFNGTQDSATKIVDDSFSGSMVIDNMDMTIDYVIGDGVDNDEISIFNNAGYALPRPAGVSIRSITKQI